MVLQDNVVQEVLWWTGVRFIQINIDLLFPTKYEFNSWEYRFIYKYIFY